MTDEMLLNARRIANDYALRTPHSTCGGGKIVVTDVRQWYEYFEAFGKCEKCGKRGTLCLITSEAARLDAVFPD